MKSSTVVVILGLVLLYLGFTIIGTALITAALVYKVVTFSLPF
jgi:Zn-dependent membrane protease YugP